MKFLTIFLIMILLTGSMVGFYYYTQEYKPAITRYNDLIKENKTLAEYLSQLRKEINNASSKETNINDTIIDELKTANAKEVFQQNVSGLRLSLPVGDLFEPGDYKLKKNGRVLIKKIVQIISRIPNTEIIVEGYTDNEKIGPKLKSKMPTNWELSALRAIDVVKFLQDSMKIEPKKLSAVAYGESRPIADNKTQNGRKKNRRIEIFIKYDKNIRHIIPNNTNNDSVIDSLIPDTANIVDSTKNNE